MNQTNLDSPAIDRLLEASKKLFSEKGFDGTGVAQIAREAGVTKSLFFHYFPTKQAALRRILEDFFNEGNTIRWENSNDRSRPGSLVEATKARINFMRRNEQVLRILMRESLSGDAPQSILEVFESIHQGQKERFREMRMGDMLEPEGQIFAFFMILLPSLAYVLFEKSFASHHGLSMEVLAEKFYGLYSHGLLETSRHLVVGQVPPPT